MKLEVANVEHFEEDTWSKNTYFVWQFIYIYNINLSRHKQSNVLKVEINIEKKYLKIVH